MTTAQILKQAKTYSINIVGDAPTLTGDPGFIVECGCARHRDGEHRALLGANMRASITAELIHGYVTAVWGPLGAGLGKHRNGKWRVYADPTSDHAKAYFTRLGA